MNPYRKNENCQECLKRREKTPMLGKTRQLIHILVLTLALGILVGIGTYFNDFRVGLPMLILCCGTTLGGTLYICNREYP